MTYDRIALQNELIRDEGLRLTPYRDSLGYLTIGVGHLITKGESFTKISNTEALDLLENDIRIAERNLTQLFPFWKQLDEVRLRAMINLSFNLGGKLAKFKRFLHSMGLSNFDKAADHLQDSLWYRQVKLRGPRVVHAIRTGTEWTGQ